MELNKPGDAMQEVESDSSLLDSDLGDNPDNSFEHNSSFSNSSNSVNITSLSSTPRHSPPPDTTAELLFNYQQHLNRTGMPPTLAPFGPFPFSSSPMLLSQQLFKPMNYLQNVNLLRPLNLTMNSMDISNLGAMAPATSSAMALCNGSESGKVSNYSSSAGHSMLATSHATSHATGHATGHATTTATSKAESASSLVSMAKSSSSSSHNHRRSSPSQVCLVCSDISSGKHYGIYACNGCSGFFKRSVRRKLIYRCQASTGNCTIDKQHRNQCQACRLTKCLSMGMNKDAVQNERQPRNTATIRPEVLMSDTNRDRMLRDGLASTVLREAYKEAYDLFAEFSSSLGQGKNGASNRLSSETSENRLSSENKDGMKKIESKGNRGDCHADTRTLLSATMANYMQHSTDSASGEAFPVSKQTIFDISKRILYASMKWTKNLSSFTNISLRDQVILIEESWAEIFLLCAIQWSLPLEKSILFPANNSPDHGGELRVLHDLFERFRTLALTSIEFECLKTLALFKPDARGLKEVGKIEQIQDQHQLTLLQHVRSHQPANPIRFGKLLLMLLSLKIIPADKIATIYFNKTIGKSSMENVLCEMFKC